MDAATLLQTLYPMQTVYCYCPSLDSADLTPVSLWAGCDCHVGHRVWYRGRSGGAAGGKSGELDETS